MDKLDGWASDQRKSLKSNLKELDDKIKDLKKQVRQAANLQEKIGLQRKAQKVEKQREDAWRAYDEAARDVESRKDKLLDDIEARLHLSSNEQHLFTVRWEIS